ncbi:MAG: hypothetical protein Q9214_003190 [Letrouitia sp. 1 TL-2023]
MASNSEIEKLRADLTAARLQAKTATQQAAAATQQAAAADQRAIQAEQKTRPTTLEELLHACHIDLFEKFAVQTIKTFTTRGSITSPAGKSCPKLLTPWTDFPKVQLEAWNDIYNSLGDARLFNSLQYIEENGQYLRRKIGSEEDLKRFQGNAIENIVSSILNELHHDVSFENNSLTLGEDAEDVQDRRSRGVPPPSKADQICVYKNADDRNELLLVIEYKAPHKLTLGILDRGLEGEIDVLKIRDEPRVYTGEEGLLHNARKLVAAAATQTYSYMLESGAEYSCIVTGEAMVFLWLKGDDTNTLRYHLAIPRDEVWDDELGGFQHPLTAIGQLTSFCHMAFESELRGEDWRKRAKEDAAVWVVDLDTMVQSMTPDIRKAKKRTTRKTTPAYYGRKSTMVKSSPYYFRKLASRQGCNPETNTFSDNRKGSGDGPGSGSDEDTYTPTKTAAARRAERKIAEAKKGKNPEAGQQQRQYCTQACLLGLVRKSAIDEACPNASQHPRVPTKNGGNQHLLNKKSFCEQVRQQLAVTMDKDIKDLRLQGSRGMLFQITLAAYGYTFVGKGTIDVFIPDLKHEARIYGRLSELQGSWIPVHLGNIDLKYPWYELGVHVIHMLLLSHGGERLDGEVSDYEGLDTQIERFKSTLDYFGVRHGDLRLPNMLYNEETQGMIFIDFERATTAADRRQELLKLISANRKRKAEAIRSGGKKVVDAENKVDLPFWEAEDEALVLPIPSPKRLSPVKEALSPEKELAISQIRQIR